MRLLTYNIWFSDHYMAQRMRAIFDIIAERKPDVVALQEMTHAHWKECSTHAAFKRYTWTEPPAGAAYYTMIGSVFPQAAPPIRTPFTASQMGRDLLASTLDTPHGRVVVGTSHLESLQFAARRKKQIAQSLHALSGDEVIFCGDTNIDESLDGDVQVCESTACRTAKTL